IARCLAAAISQAPGLSGMPDFGHCSSAATRASCARSSATPTSRTIRARPAISLGDSILQTASIARLIEPLIECVSVLTATDHIMLQSLAQVEAVGGREPAAEIPNDAADPRSRAASSRLAANARRYIERSPPAQISVEPRPRPPIPASVCGEVP